MSKALLYQLEALRLEIRAASRRRDRDSTDGYRLEGEADKYASLAIMVAEHQAEGTA